MKRGDVEQAFDYKRLDTETAEFLRKKELNMREIVGRAYTELGRELKEAQERLARQGSKYDGIFEKWYTALGFKRQRVYDLINRYNLLQNSEELYEMLEDLPVSLTYEIAKPSAESTPAKAQAKAEVLAGEIKSLKEYRDRIAELERERQQAEERANQAERARETAEHSEEITRKRLEELENREPKLEVRTEYVEIRDELAEQKLKKYEELFGDISMYEGRTTRVTNGDAITYAVFEFSEDVRKFIEKYSHLTHFAREFNDMIDEGKEEYRKAIYALNQFTRAIERRLNEKDAIILEG